MVIEERVLRRLMKRDFTSQVGVTVTRDSSWDDKSALYMHGEDWAVQIVWSKVSEKTLAAIVEMMRELPEAGTAYTLRKGDEPCYVGSLRYHFPEITKEAVEGRAQIVRTPIIYDAYSVWQKRGNNGIAMIDADTAELITGNDAHFYNGGLYTEGLASRVFINQRVFLLDDKKTDAARKLEKESWL